MQRRTLLWLTAALVTGIGAECKDAEPTQKDPNAPPEPWAAQDDFSSELKVLTISAWVEREYGPYFVKMEAIDYDASEGHRSTDNTDPHDDPRGHRQEGGTQYRWTLAYPSHHNVEVKIKVTASKAGSQKGYVAARDGKRIHRSSSFSGKNVASLDLKTQR